MTIGGRAGDASCGFILVWEFYIRRGKRRAFERVYGTRGEWARLFRAGAGYIGTDLIRDLDSPNRYFTLELEVSARL
jgi:hypothetical protein